MHKAMAAPRPNFARTGSSTFSGLSHGSSGGASPRASDTGRSPQVWFSPPASPRSARAGEGKAERRGQWPAAWDQENQRVREDVLNALQCLNASLGLVPPHEHEAAGKDQSPLQATAERGFAPLAEGPLRARAPKGGVPAGDEDFMRC